MRFQQLGARPQPAQQLDDDRLLILTEADHDGAIRYFKEKGVWKDEHQKHNDALVRRQDVLQKAWDRAIGPGWGDPLMGQGVATGNGADPLLIVAAFVAVFGLLAWIIGQPSRG